MKYIGIDYGSKRVGLALSDIDGRVAFPKEVIENNNELLSKVLDYVKLEKVETVILGESKNYKGEDNKISSEIEKFKKLLEENKIKVVLEPEFMTSVQVENNFGKNEMLDASSASIILQSFLDKQKNIKVEKVEIEQTKAIINYDDFSKIEMRVGKILSAVPVEKSEKLLKLSVDFGLLKGSPVEEREIRQIVSGIALYFPDTQVLVGKKVAFVTNLEPRKLMGLLSNGMILAVKSGEKLSLMEVPDNILEGSTLS
jgi:methionine--tRNA ligase beta chain